MSDFASCEYGGIHNCGAEAFYRITRIDRDLIGISSAAAYRESTGYIPGTLSFVRQRSGIEGGDRARKTRYGLKIVVHGPSCTGLRRVMTWETGGTVRNWW